MTVRELLGHLNIHPDKIRFYDNQDNAQDCVSCVSLYQRENGEKTFNRKLYDVFVNKYGNRDVIDWAYGYDNMLDLSF